MWITHYAFVNIFLVAETKQIGQRTGLWTILVLLVSSLLSFLLMVGILMGPAQALQKTSAIAQAMAPASPQETLTVGPTVTALQKEELAQQAKKLQNENSWS